MKHTGLDECPECERMCDEFEGRMQRRFFSPLNMKRARDELRAKLRKVCTPPPEFVQCGDKWIAK